jgi:hypothetical protein
MENFLIPLPERTQAEPNTEPERARQSVTTLAREAIAAW